MVVALIVHALDLLHCCIPDLLLLIPKNINVAMFVWALSVLEPEFDCYLQAQTSLRPICLLDMKYKDIKIFDDK